MPVGRLHGHQLVMVASGHRHRRRRRSALPAALLLGRERRRDRGRRILISPVEPTAPTGRDRRISWKQSHIYVFEYLKFMIYSLNYIYLLFMKSEA
jgi:hypothetical protein